MGTVHESHPHILTLGSSEWRLDLESYIESDVEGWYVEGGYVERWYK